MGDVGPVVTFPVHLSAGDAEPIYDEQKYTLFAYRFCPYCERVRLALSYHKIEYDLVAISLENKPDWFLRLSPSGKVPMLLNTGQRLFESDVIMRFIDELRGPEVSLLSVCGLETFQEAATMAGQFFKPAHAILYNPSFDEETTKAFRSACDNLCQKLKKGYFNGDKLSLADLLLFPMVDRLELVLGQLNALDAQSITELDATDDTDYPEVVRYLQRLRQLPEIAAIRCPTRLQALFAAGKRAGRPNPDIAL